METQFAWPPHSEFSGGANRPIGGVPKKKIATRATHSIVHYNYFWRETKFRTGDIFPGTCGRGAYWVLVVLNRRALEGVYIFSKVGTQTCLFFKTSV